MNAPHGPKAAAQRLPRKTAFTVGSVDGTISAVPIACTARAEIKMQNVADSPAITLPTTNTKA
ncbi:hypothetical protein [Corynebacterium sp.]|uniref:hypothetical protein n=1 Tax=Corynebacterium sp. TaxID=1720 RepID=UPI00290E32C4|nr:hypothetical protein [Corynebacterium sp.]MDU4569357.1 hypothetical protein [Corynebacterium sp.]